MPRISPRCTWTESPSGNRNGRRNSHDDAAMPNASVATARNRPRSRNAGAPITSATSMPTTVTTRTETPKLSPSRTRAAVPNAPIPANANWPSES